MGAADSWAAFKKRCERDPNYSRRKREEWSEASGIRRKMEQWGCYNCPFLENITNGSGDIADGCKAIDDKGVEVKRLHVCPNPKRTRTIMASENDESEDMLDN